MYELNDCPCIKGNHRLHWSEQDYQCEACEDRAKVSDAGRDWTIIYKNILELDESHDLKIRDILDVVDSIMCPLLDRLDEEVGK